MIIVNILGGIGNQMFQYALYRRLSLTNNDLFINKKDFEEYNLHNGYQLEDIFNVSPRCAGYEQIYKLKREPSLKGKLIKKFLGEKKTYIEIEELTFDNNILNQQNAYLFGYWQSEKYFKDIEKVIREDFKFKNELGEENLKIVEEMKKVNSVSIHIRRGDYLKPEINKLYGGICEINYYKRAITHIENNVSNPYYFVFSNDIEWCKENLQLERVNFIDCNNGRDSYKDMQLMSKCKHNIIANSSFSWWGAWLNENKDKLVISPSRWINGIKSDIDDIIPATWIKL